MPYLTPARESGPVLPPRPIIALRRFLTPVREAGGGGGHWVTLNSDDESGGTHIFITASGSITKGPASLVGHHIGSVASHPSAKPVKHHPEGHVPEGATNHPSYTEKAAQAQPEGAQQEKVKNPGKPYARLHGADQGDKDSRKTVIGAALQKAQAEAKQANDPATKLADAAVAHDAAKTALHQHRAKADKYANPYAPHLSPPVDDDTDRALAEKATRAEVAHQTASDRYATPKPAAGKTTPQTAAPRPSSTDVPPAPENETPDEKTSRLRNLVLTHRAHEERQLQNGNYDRADKHKAIHEQAAKDLDAHLMAQAMAKPVAGMKAAEGMRADAQRKQDSYRQEAERRMRGPEPARPVTPTPAAPQAKQGKQPNPYDVPKMTDEERVGALKALAGMLRSEQQPTTTPAPAARAEGTAAKPSYAPLSMAARAIAKADKPDIVTEGRANTAAQIAQGARMYANRGTPGYEFLSDPSHPIHEEIQRATPQYGQHNAHLGRAQALTQAQYKLEDTFAKTAGRADTEHRNQHPLKAEHDAAIGRITARIAHHKEQANILKPAAEAQAGEVAKIIAKYAPEMGKHRVRESAAPAQRYHTPAAR